MLYNKNRSLLIPGFIFLVLVFSACKKSFINDILPTNSATPAQVFASSDAVRAYFSGIYRTMRSQWQSTDGTAGNSTDSWGLSSIFLVRDVKGKDIVMPYNSWYYFDYQNDNREPTYRRTRFTWYFFYELINQLNVLIDGTQKSVTILDSDKPILVAEARALRAYCYFELIREFQFTITKDPNAPGIPIYTNATTLDVLGNPRGTIKQTYDQINTDIDFALKNLGADRNLKNQVNISVAWGIAARIYLEQGKWADAETAAANALKDHSLDAAGYPNNYNGLVSSEVIWGFPQTTENGGQSLYYGSPSSFFEKTGEGYNAFWISKELAAHFTTTDVRNTFFVYNPDSTEPDYLATNKFGKASTNTLTLVNGKDVPQKTTDFSESLNMMRAGEMYLIWAEAKARQNKLDAANTLYELQKNRDPMAEKSGNTGPALINEILLERRKELYGEMGIDWLDAKRLQLPIDRRGSNHPTPYDFVIPANDPKFNLKIPQTELQANKNMSPSDQNP